MNTSPLSHNQDLPVYDGETDICYTLDVIAELAGVDTRTVLHYQEQGFLRPATGETGSDVKFDSESLRQLRRIDHLRSTCEMNDTGLRLVLGLLEEAERLREERRQWFR